MQNVIYAVIGVILTVAAMYMVAPSINNSSEAIKANLVATEISAVKNSAKLWLANESTDGTFNTINAESLKNYLNELQQTGTGATSAFTSKAGAGVKISVVASDVNTTNDAITITATGLSTKQATQVAKSVKDLTHDGVEPTPTGNDNNKTITVEIKG